MTFSNLTVLRLLDGFKKKQFSRSEVGEYFWEKIKKENKQFNAVLHLAEEPPHHFDRGPLSGIPYGLKNNITCIASPTTCGSRILEEFYSPDNATVVQKLANAGAYPLATTNLDEFAMGSSTENSAFGPTRNPWDKERVPGGSSGGSAVAVAAGLVPFALGSDTGGSIRQPAAFCGVVGLKPTYGRVSRYGLVSLASSLDQIGLFTKDVSDAAFLLPFLAGKDKRDETSKNVPKDFAKNLKAGVRGLKIGLIKEFFKGETKNLAAKRIKLLQKEGAKLIEISLPLASLSIAIYYLIQPAEASSNLARYDGVRYGFSAGADREIEGVERMIISSRSVGFGKEVKRRIILGTFVLSEGYRESYYLKAVAARAALIAQIRRAFSKVDVLVSPTTPTVAFKLGEKQDPLAMYLSDLFTAPANLAGLPAISVPCGLSRGLPVGLQIMGRPFDEATVLRAAYTFEQTLGNWREK